MPRRRPVCRDLPAGRALAYPPTRVRSEFPKIGALWPHVGHEPLCASHRPFRAQSSQPAGDVHSRHRHVPGPTQARRGPGPRPGSRASRRCDILWDTLIDETWSWSPRPAVVGRRPAIRTACWPEPPRPVEPHPAPRGEENRSERVRSCLRGARRLDWGASTCSRSPTSAPTSRARPPPGRHPARGREPVPGDRVARTRCRVARGGDARSGGGGRRPCSERTGGRRCASPPAPMGMLRGGLVTLARDPPPRVTQTASRSGGRARPAPR